MGKKLGPRGPLVKINGPIVTAKIDSLHLTRTELRERCNRKVGLDTIRKAEQSRSIGYEYAQYIAGALELNVEDIIVKENPSDGHQNHIDLHLGGSETWPNLLSESIEDRYSKDAAKLDFKDAAQKEAVSRIAFFEFRLWGLGINLERDPGPEEWRIGPQPRFNGLWELWDFVQLTVIGSEFTAALSRDDDLTEALILAMAEQFTKNIARSRNSVSAQSVDQVESSAMQKAIMYRLSREAPDAHDDKKPYDKNLENLILAEQEADARARFLSYCLWKIGRDQRYTFLIEDPTRLAEFTMLNVLGSELAALKGRERSLYTSDAEKIEATVHERLGIKQA